MCNSWWCCHQVSGVKWGWEGSREQNPFLHLPGVVSEPLVLAGDQGPVEREPQGTPWEEAIQSPAEGLAFPLQVLTPLGSPAPFLVCSS